MFAYCGNNPVNLEDSTGTYYTSGQIHDFVIEDACRGDKNKRTSRKDNKITYRYLWFKYYGYCDIYDRKTNEIWEVKRFSLAPSCLFSAAELQLNGYLSGQIACDKAATLCAGGTKTYISPNVFLKPDNDGEGVYVIGYFDTGLGIIYYDYRYIPSGNELLVTIAAVALAALAGYAGALPAVAALA